MRAFMGQMCSRAPGPTDEDRGGELNEGGDTPRRTRVAAHNNNGTTTTHTHTHKKKTRPSLCERLFAFQRICRFPTGFSKDTVFSGNWTASCLHSPSHIRPSASHQRRSPSLARLAVRGSVNFELGKEGHRERR